MWEIVAFFLKRNFTCSHIILTWPYIFNLFLTLGPQLLTIYLKKKSFLINNKKNLTFCNVKNSSKCILNLISTFLFRQNSTYSTKILTWPYLFTPFLCPQTTENLSDPFRNQYFYIQVANLKDWDRKRILARKYIHQGIYLFRPYSNI